MSFHIYNSDTETLTEKKVDTGTTDGMKLVVYNDDFHTFDFVIESLVQVCAHPPEQAEQLTLQIHFKGRAIVKTGDEEMLSPMHRALCERQLTAEIQ
ncbi:MAG: ATP-dependent Clp protease adaptor ClpS [Bacteroidia bacterium]